MKVVRNFVLIFIAFNASGCTEVPPTTSKFFKVNSNCQEINLQPMGTRKYQLQIKGNGYYNLKIKGNDCSNQRDIRAQFTKEVKGVCKGGYEIHNIETRNITSSGYKNPMAEGDFSCK